MTTVQAFYFLSLGCSAVAAFDALRRPASAWIVADRKRGIWVTWITLLGILFLGHHRGGDLPVRVGAEVRPTQIGEWIRKEQAMTDG